MNKKLFNSITKFLQETELTCLKDKAAASKLLSQMGVKTRTQYKQIEFMGYLVSPEKLIEINKHRRSENKKIQAIKIMREATSPYLGLIDAKRAMDDYWKLPFVYPKTPGKE